MAQDFDEESPKKKSSSKKLIIILLLVLIIGGGGAAGAWYFLSQQHAAPHKEAEAKPEPAKPPVFLALETFTVNLQPDPDDQYLQVELTLKVANNETAELLKLHMPEVRNRVLLLLSSKKSSEVTSLEGKKVLSDEIIAQLKEPFSQGAKPQEVDGVFFTSFVVQ
ncbi:MAG: flagellar basal body-associated protein FliL [Methylophilaceae bacterium]|uniref:flagellar basal body-associated protein FliL n=1 Tax=Methylovorus sp. MM2 TaxID=1848038 RepID=UPI0007DE7C22|nr:flagellar basal body-associated protein FliL [Methylovorus sp. MM2]OAM51263.1 flagellar basal body-associated protein FliL [Methylovorus sp. MM2]